MSNAVVKRSFYKAEFVFDPFDENGNQMIHVEFEHMKERGERDAYGQQLEPDHEEIYIESAYLIVNKNPLPFPWDKYPEEMVLEAVKEHYSEWEPNA
jgi:hypothetical protein